MASGIAGGPFAIDLLWVCETPLYYELRSATELNVSNGVTKFNHKRKKRYIRLRTSRQKAWLPKNPAQMHILIVPVSLF
jgi:hypothetical protein